MPLIDFYPKVESLEEALDSQMNAIRLAMKRIFQSVANLPSSDVIVTLHKCSVRNPDPQGADLLVFLDTTPDEGLEENADKLRDLVALSLKELGVTENRNVEVWLRFLPGSWLLISGPRIIETVEHN